MSPPLQQNENNCKSNPKMYKTNQIQPKFKPYKIQQIIHIVFLNYCKGFLSLIQLQPCIVNHTVTCPCAVQAQKTFHTAVRGPPFSLE